MQITVPVNTIPFRIDLSTKSSFQMKGDKETIKLLKLAKGIQKELHRTLLANCFTVSGFFMCNYEALYSMGRLAFSFSKHATVADWPMINHSIQNNPDVIFKILGLKPENWYSEEQFFFFTLEGMSTELSIDLATAGRVAGKLTRLTKTK